MSNYVLAAGIDGTFFNYDHRFVYGFSVHRSGDIDINLKFGETW